MRKFKKSTKVQRSFLFYKLNVLFTDADELGLSREGTRDFMPHIEQYDAEVSTIVPRLMEEVENEQDVLNIVYEEFCDWFTEDFVSPKERWEELSSKTWEILLSLSQPEENE
jgi:hypothetical protein